MWQRTKPAKGSVLLLVVGLLTIIAMLGCTFLVVARMHGSQATGFSANEHVQLAAAAAVQKVLCDLKANLGFDAALVNPRPYGGVDNADGWKAYAPYHAYTRFLHCMDSVDTHRSEIYGNGSTFVNTDGGTEINGYLIPLQAAESEIGRIMVAAKVIDLSGLLCVNTAGQPGVTDVIVNTMAANRMTNIDLGTYLGATYATVHAARSGSVVQTLPDYYNNVAVRLFTPAGLPFAVTDEIFLRSMKDTSSLVNTGRFYSLAPLLSSLRKNLATYTCSRSIPRHPVVADGFDKRIPLTRVSLDNAILRTRLLTELSACAADGVSIGGGGGGGGSYEKKYDFGSGPLATGYSAPGGEGSWKVAPTYGPFDTGIGDALTRDFVYGQGAVTFGIKVPDPGEYQVTAIIGDPRTTEAHVITVTAEGVVIASNVLCNGGSVKSCSGKVNVSDGEVTITVGPGVGGGSGWWTWCGVTVTKAGGGGTSVNIASDIAASFVANLWADLTPFNEAQAKAFAVTNTNGTVYGLINQPVFSEVYVRNVPSTDNGAANDYKMATAIELFNPTSTNIPLVGAGFSYKLTGLSGTPSEFVFPAGTSIAAGGRLVIYDYEYGAATPPPQNPQADFGLPPQAAGAWIRVPGLLLQKQSNIRLVRLAEGQTISTDSVDRSEIDNYSVADPATTAEAMWSFQRDDSPGRHRCLVAAYKKLTTASLMGANSVGEVDLAEVKQGFQADVKHGIPIDQIGKLSQIYIVAPTAPTATAAGVDMPHGLYALRQDVARGHADYRGKVKDAAARYPDVPMATILGELFECLTPDLTRTSDDPSKTRVYGRININTAPEEVLKKLPFPTSITLSNGHIYPVSGAAAVTEILKYRRLALDKSVVYSIDKLRGGIDATKFRSGGFLTPGEIAIPLAWYMETVAAAEKDTACYLEARDALYTAISNVITVNSDTYAVHLRMQCGDDANAPRTIQYYLAIIDRSNCNSIDDKPAILLFTPMPY